MIRHAKTGESCMLKVTNRKNKIPTNTQMIENIKEAIFFIIIEFNPGNNKNKKI